MKEEITTVVGQRVAPVAALAALEAAAQSWSGTPFCEQSAVKGAGVCCHAAVMEVYFEAGWLPRFAYPIAPMRDGIRALEQFFGGAAHAPTRVAADAPSVAPHFTRHELAELQPGDTLYFAGRTIAHFALQLGAGRIFHAQHGSAAGIAPNLPTAWMKRFVCLYRPLV